MPPVTVPTARPRRAGGVRAAAAATIVWATTASSPTAASAASSATAPGRESGGQQGDGEQCELAGDPRRRRSSRSPSGTRAQQAVMA